MIFKYPFLYFGIFGIKPVIIVFWIIIVFLMLIQAINRTEFKFNIDIPSIFSNIYKRNKLVSCISVFVLPIGIYYLQDILNIKELFIYNIASTFLKFEFFISILLFFSYIVGMVIVQKNKFTFLNFLNKILVIFICTSTFSTLITNQIIMKGYNILVLLSVFLITTILSIFDFEKNADNSKQNNSPISFLPVEKFKDLFESNKSHAMKIKNIINEKHEEPVCICVSGKWGTGKTSVINGAIDLIKSESPNHLFIRINALEIDDESGLFRYFFNNIKLYLQQQGIYNGISSEYQKFIASSIGTITNGSVSELFKSKVFSSNKDYRHEKNELNQLLIDVLDNQKIIVILDDVERCTPEKVLQFIFFVKEVATFTNCISIFATDYDILYELCKEKINNTFFFDKFFNYRINVTDVKFDSILDYYKQNTDQSNPINKILKDDIYSNIYFIKKKFNLEIDHKNKSMNELRGLEKSDSRIKCLKKDIDYLKTMKNLFLNHVNNPRKLSKLYHSYNINCKILENEYVTLISEKRLELEKYANKIHLGKLLFLISYIETCLPSEYYEIQNNGILGYFNYLNYFDEDEFDNIYMDKALVLNISEGILFEERIIENDMFNIKHEYLHINAMKFFDTIIHKQQELSKIVTEYNSQTEEWLEAIDNNTLKNYESSLLSIFSEILRTFAYSDVDKGRMYLKKLFDFQFENNIYVWDYFLLKENSRLIITKLRFMDIFYDTFCGINYQDKLNPKLKKRLENISDQYTFARLTKITNLLRYFDNDLIIEDEIESIIKNGLYIDSSIEDSSIEDSSIEDSSIEDSILTFVYKAKNIIGISKPLDDLNSIEKLKFLANSIENKLKEFNISEYSDVQTHIKDMYADIKDIEYFIKIYNFIKKNSVGNINMKLISNDNLNEYIKYFDDILESGIDILTTAFHESFSDFFNTLENTNYIQISDEYIIKLHDLVSKYFDVSGCDTVEYRKCLINLKFKNTKIV